MNKYRYYFWAIILINIIFSVIASCSLSISYYEALVINEGKGLTSWIARISIAIFGNNDFAFRAPFVFLNTLSAALIYQISSYFLKRKSDCLFAMLVFTLLPGVIASGVLVHSSVVVMFFTLLLIRIYLLGHIRIFYIFLVLSFIFEDSFFILYLALFFYGIFKKDKVLFSVALSLFSISMYKHGFDTGGKPKGYFLDTIGLYATIFSPVVFIFFVYSLYRILIKENKNILWFISFGTLLISLLLSMRQKLPVESFAPFVIIGIPLMIKVFSSSYHSRLPQFRSFYKIVIFFGISTLFVSTSILLFNKALYLYLKDPQDHFMYRFHVAKELSSLLKNKGIYEVVSDDERLQLRLKMYGIKEGGLLMRENIKNIKCDNFIEIRYMGNDIVSYCLVKPSANLK